MTTKSRGIETPELGDHPGGAIMRETYDVSRVSTSATHTSAPTRLNLAGARGQNHRTPGLVDGQFNNTKEWRVKIFRVHSR